MIQKLVNTLVGMIARKKPAQRVGGLPDVSAAARPLPQLPSRAHNPTFREVRIDLLATAHFSVWAASTVKPENDVLLGADGGETERSNEDRYRIRHFESGTITAAVADGAGGEGLFCGEWAEELLEKLPNAPIANCDDVANWLESFREGFSERFGQRASADYFLQKKFEREGALSTLSAVWLQSGNFGTRLDAFRYGDSPIFIWNFRSHPVLRLAWPESFDSYATNPYLVNCNRSLVPSKVEIVSNIALVPGDMVVVATDGIGQYISLLAAYWDQGERPCSPCAASMRSTADLILSNNDSALAALVRAHKNNHMAARFDALEDIRRGFQTANSFAEFVRSQYVKGLLPNDDCTAIVIQVCERPMKRSSVFGRHTRGVLE